MSKAEGWLEVLGPVIGMVAGLMVIVGIYFLDPAAIDLGFTLTAERTWLVGAFLIAAGSALAFKLMLPKGVDSGSLIVDLLFGLVIGQLSHFAYGFIAAAIGVQALIAQTPNYWAALLLVPALLSLVIAFSDDDDETDDEADGIAEEEGNHGDEAESDSDSADLPAAAWAGLFLGGLLALYMFAFMAVIGFAFWLYTQLKLIIIDGGTADLGNLPIWKMNVDTLVLLVLLGGGLALGLAVIFSVSALWSSRKSTAATKPVPRRANDSFIDASEEAVHAYAKAQGYDRNNSLWDLFELVSVIAAIGVGAIVTFGGIALIERVPDGTSFPVILSPFGASAIVSLFAFLMLGNLPKSIWSRLSRRFSERAGWVMLRPKKHPDALRNKLVSFVRAGRLSTVTPIKPGEFLHAANLSVERYYYIPAAALFAISLLLLDRDLNTADVLTAQKIEVTDYWTMVKTSYGYDDVREVELRCYLTDKGEPVEAYVLRFKDGQELDIYKSQLIVEKQLTAYEAIDAKLVALAVPFVPGSHQGWFKRDQRGYDADCVETLAGEFPEALRPRVKKLFHMEQMQVVAEIWPWDSELAEAQRAANDYDVDQAVALFTKAIASGRLPENLLAVAHSGRGNARDWHTIAYGLRDEEMLLALRDYQKARELAPSFSTYENEAVTLMALGAYDKAVAAYRKAVELDGSKPYSSLIGLARVERVRGNFDVALQTLDKVLRVWGEENVTSSVHYGRARVLYLKLDDASVVEATTKSVDLDGNLDGAYRFRACAYARLGNFAKAKSDNEKAIEIAKVPAINLKWEETPMAAAYYAEFESDRKIINAMAAGTATSEERAKLCGDLWRYRETPRTRSSLLPAKG